MMSIFQSLNKFIIRLQGWIEVDWFAHVIACYGLLLLLSMWSCTVIYMAESVNDIRKNFMSSNNLIENPKKLYP